jgi:hypothetical protein
MKIFALLAFLVFTATQSFAQLDDEKLVYLKKAEKFRKMKNTGATLTIGGSALIAVGLVTMINSSYVTTYDGGGQSHTTTEGNPGLGIAAYLAGNACVGAGIPLWIIGKNNYRKYNNKVNDLSSGIRLRPQANGLTLTYRF